MYMFTENEKKHKINAIVGNNFNLYVHNWGCYSTIFTFLY